MALTGNEVEFVGNVYDPSIRLRFFSFASISIPNAKESKPIQVTST